MAVNAEPGFECKYGIHEWFDQYGNRGTELLGQRHLTVGTFWSHSLFNPNHERSGTRLADYFSHAGPLARRIFVVVDTHLPAEQKAQVEDYFVWCKTEELLEDYMIMPIAVSPIEKTLRKVELVRDAAKKFGLKRRDMFLAIGSTMVTDVVGFVAAIYRRSTPWILVSTDLVGILRGSACDNKLSIHHISHHGAIHKEALALSHPPIANCFNPNSLKPLLAEQVRRFLAEIIKISVFKNYELFSNVESHVEKMLERPQQVAHLITAIDLASRSAVQDVNQIPSEKGVYLSGIEFGDEAVYAVNRIKGFTSEDGDSIAVSVALMSTISALKGNLSDADLERILDLLERAGLPVFDGSFEANLLWKHMIDASQEKGGAFAFSVPITIGKAETLHAAGLTLEDIDAALSLLQRRCQRSPSSSSHYETITPLTDGIIAGHGFHEQRMSEDVRYHVVSVPQILNESNLTMIQAYCAKNNTGRKKKLLVVVDPQLDSIITNIDGYFKAHRSAIDDFHILSVPVSSAYKDMDAVLRVVDAAIELGISQQDLVLVFGGGTLLDIVGFAAAMYKGGIPYLRIPTTLVGMIDAGIGMKVGVNVGIHKSMIGRYFSPVACLNDPETFLVTLPQQEFACGLAEAMKMGIVKSPRLFELIEKHHRDVRYNPYTQELIYLSVHNMLEELQPNLYEDDLRRIVDFGHEFGHIVEALARHEIPHGKCVAIGMAISSYLAHLKGILKQPDLERILNCILDLGLPIYVTDHDCCNADALWDKISTDGTGHKDGMLYLSVPETIGKAKFLDNISDIDAELQRKAMLSLRQYETRNTGVNRSKTGSLPLSGNKSSFCNDPQSFSGSNRTLSSHNILRTIGEKPLITKAAILGASGDIGSGLVDYLLRNGLQVICSVRYASLHKFEKRTNFTHPALRTLAGDVTDLANLRIIIRQTDILYNMAGFCSLAAKPDEFAKVIALNGFIQGIITHLIQDMGRGQDMKVVYPSSQRVHLTTGNTAVDEWVQEASAAFSGHKEALIAEQDIYTALERFSAQFIASHPLPSGLNIYEISKVLGECFVSQLPRYSLMRISSVYGSAFIRGFVHRAIHPSPEGNVEAPEKRDFIFVDDLNELLWKAAQLNTTDSYCFDAASGESIDLQEAWDMIREEIGDGATITFKSGVAQEVLNPNPAFARLLLDREFTSMRLGLRNTIDGSVRGVKEKGSDFLRRQDKPHIIVVDVGATYLRIGVMGPDGCLLHQPTRICSPSRQSNTRNTLEMLQEKLLETLVQGINTIKASHDNLFLDEVGISFGAVITREGIVQDASILWGDPAHGYDFKEALIKRLPGARLTILNDVSAAAWRYIDVGRYCLITVSSGLSNKVFNPELNTMEKLDLDAAGVGGEMGHVVVEPRAVDALVQHAILQARAHPEELRRSRLYIYVNGDAQKISARLLGKAAKEQDAFALRLLEEADIPYCSCGNIADLCSYSSGRGALRLARGLAARERYSVAPEDVTDEWLKHAIATGHPLGLKALKASTYYLALRILQLAADLGLDKFIIVGGFALKTANGAYLQALQDHLVRLCAPTGFFSAWSENQVRQLVRLGINDDNDGLIGMGHLVRHFRAHYCAVEKPIGEHSLLVMKRSIPSYGSLEILAKVVYSGICTTDLQILRGERGLEPIVLGHEAVCQVVEVGENVRGVSLGEVVLLNPNNPLDDYDKLGHNREGLFQEYIKFGQEFLDRKQVLTLGNSALSATYTMIEPLSGVIAAQDRIKDRIPGRNVLIVGAGVMGLLFALLNVKSNARNVFLANRSKGKLEFAISRGIVQEGKTFDSSRGISSPLLEVSAGEGADIVIVCVSRGQGAPVAQEALTYVNPGGCVYLFAGFCSGDLLTLDEGQKLDAWSIRTCWRTERVCITGKTVDVSGHRGSRQEDLALAAHLIRSDTLYFSKVISHIISLQAVPETALALAMDENILGMPAKRVVVDMDARGRVVERAEELPFRHLYEAAGKPKAAVSMGNMFREIGFEGSMSTLGWANSPTWQDIQVALEMALKVSALNSKRHIIWVGTGAWAFLVDALKEITPASRDITFHTLYSLDPQALATLFSLIEDLSMAVCLGISESGKTVETVILMNTLRERFEGAGLDHRHHFVWLTSISKPEFGKKSGEEVIRSSVGHDWKKVAMVPLTVQNQSSINAFFCAPHSMAMFLPLILMLQKDWKTMQHMYQQYLASKDSIARSILSKAYFVASNHVDCLQVNLDESIAPTMARLVVQLIEQALGSKQDGFNPQVRVGSGTQVAPNGFEIVALPVPIEVPAVVKLMVTMNALSVFVATVAYHRVIEFSTHPKVDLYKRRAAELVAAAEIEQKISDPTAISDEILAYVKHDSQLKCAQIICYGTPPVSRWRNTKWVASCLAQAAQHIAVEIIKGEDWNHSQYQAAVQRKDFLYVVLVLPEYRQHVEGISKEAIFGNIRMLLAIARATFETLRPKALIFRIREEFPSTDSR